MYLFNVYSTARPHKKKKNRSFQINICISPIIVESEEVPYITFFRTVSTAQKCCKKCIGTHTHTHTHTV